MKKSLLGLLTVSAALLLASCGDGNQPASSPSASDPASSDASGAASTGDSSPAASFAFDDFVASLEPLNFTYAQEDAFTIAFAGEIAKTTFESEQGDSEVYYAKIEGKGIGAFGADSNGQMYFGGFISPNDNVSLDKVLPSPLPLLKLEDAWIQSVTDEKTYVLDSPRAYKSLVANAVAMDAEYLSSISSVKITLDEGKATLRAKYTLTNGTTYNDEIVVAAIGSTRVTGISALIEEAKDYTKTNWDSSEYGEQDILEYLGLKNKFPFDLFSEYAYIDVNYDDDDNLGFYGTDINPKFASAGAFKDALKAKNLGWQDCDKYGQYETADLKVLELPNATNPKDVTLLMIGFEAADEDGVYPNGVLSFQFSSYTYPDYETLEEANALLANAPICAQGNAKVFAADAGMTGIAIWDYTDAQNAFYAEYLDYAPMFGLELSSDFETFLTYTHVEISFANVLDAVDYVDAYMALYQEYGFVAEAEEEDDDPSVLSAYRLDDSSAPAQEAAYPSAGETGSLYIGTADYLSSVSVTLTYDETTMEGYASFDFVRYSSEDALTFTYYVYLMSMMS